MKYFIAAAALIASVPVIYYAAESLGELINEVRTGSLKDKWFAVSFGAVLTGTIFLAVFADYHALRTLFGGAA